MSQFSLPRRRLSLVKSCYVRASQLPTCLTCLVVQPSVRPSARSTAPPPDPSNKPAACSVHAPTSCCLSATLIVSRWLVYVGFHTGAKKYLFTRATLIIRMHAKQSCTFFRMHPTTFAAAAAAAAAPVPCTPAPEVQLAVTRGFVHIIHHSSEDSRRLSFSLPRSVQSIKMFDSFLYRLKIPSVPR